MSANDDWHLEKRSRNKMLVTDCIWWCTFHVFVSFCHRCLEISLIFTKDSCRASLEYLGLFLLWGVTRASNLWMNSYDSLCAAHLLLSILRLTLTSALLQVQLFWSLRLGWSQHQYSSILHRSWKYRLAASNSHKYQWLDAGECKWTQFKNTEVDRKAFFTFHVGWS